MRTRIAFGLLLLMLSAAVQATVLRVVMVEAPDVTAYAKALEQLESVLKSKGSPVKIRIWRATFAGPETGTVAVSAEYPNLEALAKDNDRIANDPEVRSAFSTLDKLRKIVSDSLYNEL